MQRKHTDRGNIPMKEDQLHSYLELAPRIFVANCSTSLPDASQSLVVGKFLSMRSKRFSAMGSSICSILIAMEAAISIKFLQLSTLWLSFFGARPALLRTRCSISMDRARIALVKNRCFSPR